MARSPRCSAWNCSIDSDDLMRICLSSFRSWIIKGVPRVGYGSSPRKEANSASRSALTDLLPIVGPSETRVFRLLPRWRAGGASGSHEGSRGLVADGAMRPVFVVQHGLRTPTGRCAENFFTGFIPGLGATFSFTARPTKAVASSVARWTVRRWRVRSRSRPGCSIALHAGPSFALRSPPWSTWRPSAHCRRYSTGC
jgi:hypothetical protein